MRAPSAAADLTADLAADTGTRGDPAPPGPLCVCGEGGDRACRAGTPLRLLARRCSETGALQGRAVPPVTTARPGVARLVALSGAAVLAPGSASTPLRCVPSGQGSRPACRVGPGRCPQGPGCGQAALPAGPGESRPSLARGGARRGRAGASVQRGHPERCLVGGDRSAGGARTETRRRLRAADGGAHPAPPPPGARELGALAASPKRLLKARVADTWHTRGQRSGRSPRARREEPPRGSHASGGRVRAQPPPWNSHGPGGGRRLRGPPRRSPQPRKPPPTLLTGVRRDKRLRRARSLPVTPPTSAEVVNAPEHVPCGTGRSSRFQAAPEPEAAHTRRAAAQTDKPMVRPAAPTCQLQPPKRTGSSGSFG